MLDDDAPRSTASAEADNALSLATASAGQSVQLRFWVSLEQQATQDALNYQATVNGEIIEPEALTYDSAQRTVTLALPAGTLGRAGIVQVNWLRLRDTQSRLLTGSAGPLIVR